MVINKAENKQINLTINNVWPGINLHKREIKVPKKKDPIGKLKNWFLQIKNPTVQLKKNDNKINKYTVGLIISFL